MNKLIQILIILFIINNITYSNSWEFIKGPSTNRNITAIEIDKETIYIGLNEKLFKSTDFGKNWIEIKYNDTLSFSNIKNIIKLDSIIFLQSTYRTQGINYEMMKSTDNGRTWKEENFDVQLGYVKFITKYGNYIYANIINMVGNEGKQKTLKYDKNNDKWVEIIDDTLYSKIRNNIKTITEYNGKIYLGTEISQGSIDQGYKRPNIYIYDTLSKQMISIVDTSSDLWKSYVNCILVKDNELFIGTSTGVYKSTDEGITWIRKSNGLHFKNEYYDYDYEIHKMTEYDGIIYGITNPPRPYGNYYSAYTTLVYSTDNGESWINDTLFTLDAPQEVKVVNNKLLISSYYGLFETDKFLTKKTQIIKDTLNSGFVYDFYADNERIYATKANDFIYQISVNKNEKWERLAKKQAISINIAYDFCKINQNLYALLGNSYGKNSLVVSNDTGNTFRYATDPKMMNIPYYGIYVHTNDSVYVTNNWGIFLSNDEGKNWQKITEDGFTYKVLKLLKVGDYLFAGTIDYGLIKSVDGGKSWKKLKLPTSYDEITIKDILYYKKKLYIATIQTYDPSKKIRVRGEGIFMSSDLGESWEKKNKRYPDSLETVSLESYGDYIFAATNWHGGVYYSSNEGADWYPLNNGLAGYTMNRIRVFGDYLYAGTSTGLYRYNLKNLVVSVDDSQINVKPDYLWASVAYPNPARDYVQAKVWWDTHNDIEKAEIVVYDIYGNQVSGRDKVTIIPENDYSGLIRWDCSSDPAGVYLLTIKHGSETRTIRMIKQ